MRVALWFRYEAWRIATARPPEEIALLVTPGAKPVTAEALIAASDIVILALPLSRYRSLPREQLAGKIVIDAMNY